MTGSGLGNFGLGNIGMFGQQQWQKDAREEAFRRGYQSNLQRLGPQSSADPVLQAMARFQSASAIEQGASRLGASGSIAGTSPRDIMIGAYNQAMAIGGPNAPDPRQANNFENPWYMGIPSLQFPY